MQFEIIDAHMHPFLFEHENSASFFKPVSQAGELWHDMERAGISRFCGSVVRRVSGQSWEEIALLNQSALKLWDLWPDKYIPGVHIHPAFPRESCAELERMHKLGIRLIGELVPYMMNWDSYTSPGALEIFTLAQELGMAVSAHPTNDEDMDRLARAFPRLNIVFAHPGNFDVCSRNAQRLVQFDNVFLDICGTGLFRYGMLKYLVDRAGESKLLFGTDYPICNPLMQVAGVQYENISDRQREAIFSGNAKRLFALG